MQHADALERDQRTKQIESQPTCLLDRELLLTQSLRERLALDDVLDQNATINWMMQKLDPLRDELAVDAPQKRCFLLEQVNQPRLPLGRWEQPFEDDLTLTILVHSRPDFADAAGRDTAHRAIVAADEHAGREVSRADKHILDTTADDLGRHVRLMRQRTVNEIVHQPWGRLIGSRSSYSTNRRTGTQP